MLDGRCGADLFRHLQFLLLILQLVQTIINSSLRQKFLVRALFPHAAFMKDEDTVGVLDGAEAVGDDQRGAAGEQAVESFPYEHFRFGINAGGGFIENQEARIVGQGARKIYQLPLSD